MLRCGVIGAVFWGGVASAHHITEVVIDGNIRTREAWVLEYLELELPKDLSDADIANLRQKLLTTSVFISVKTEIKEVDSSSRDEVLVISLDEKWTLTPVVRGAYGGGTPLKVAGIYDTHAFGSLWTVGLEGRQYGNSPVGGVVWGRAPRWITGKHLVGGEGWREFRERIVYDSDGESVGSVKTSATAARGHLLAPIKAFGSSTNWQGGLDARLRRDGLGRFDPFLDRSEAQPERVVLPESAIDEVSFLPTVVFDNVKIDNLNLDGIRFSVLSGPLLTEEGYFSKSEADFFAFQDFGHDLNLAIHSFVAQTTQDRFSGQYFLGGFDSVRGYPDGISFGQRTAHATIELRRVFSRYKYLWLQSAGFVDVGSAVDEWRDFGAKTKQAAGLGIRFAVPQIYRFVLRFDFAWSLDGSGSKGITAGLNQFFDPYKPL